MRIVHCIWRMGLGGTELQLVRLASGLIGRHADVHVVTAFAGECDARLAGTGATMHRLRPFGKYDVTLIPRLVPLLRRLRPDVVTTALTQMDIVAGLACRMAGVPWVLCERSGAAAYPSSALHAVRVRVGKRANAIVANAEVGREYWRQFVDEARIHVIPNIVPVEEIERAGSAAADGEIILCAGRFSAEKNLDRLLESLAVVFSGRAVRAVFCGDGPLRAAAERKAAALGIADRTLFLGAVPDVWSWMKRAAVVVSASAFEGNPNVVLEAMAAGAPLVVSDIPAHRALLSEQSAWLVDPNSAESIAAGLIAALAGADERRRRAERARAAIGARSADDIAARYLDVFSSVARRTN